MSEPSARQRFVEAMRPLVAQIDVSFRHNLRQAIEAFADAECGARPIINGPGWVAWRCQSEEADHDGCRATLLRDCGLSDD